MPQDVHPQQYQAANVGAPPGPQWGAQAPVQAPPNQGPVAPGPGNDWNSRRLAAIDQPSNIYGERDPIRAQLPPRQPSPRQDQMRQYQQQEPQRHTPLRRPSPAPNMNHAPQTAYPGPSSLSQPAPLQPPPPPIPTRERITNPNYPAPNPIGPSNGTHGGPGPAASYRVPDGRGNSPPPQIPPLVDDRMSSPNSGYPHQPFNPHSANTSHPGGIASGAPPPMAALAAAEAAAQREREERPVLNAFKRMVEEDDYKLPNKKPVNGDTRARLEDHNYRRDSPTERPPQSPPRHRRSSSEIRREEQIRRADMNYHPSEAAHHPTSLPPLHSHPEHLPPVAEPPREARREPFRDEPAAREVDVDDNYDDEGEDDKRMVGSGGRNSPQSRGLMNGQTKVEPQG